MRLPKFLRPFRSMDFRLSASLLTLLVQGVAWSSGFIALLLVISRMSPAFSRIPPEIQFACAALAVLAAALLLRMLLERRRALKAYNELLQAVSLFPVAGREDRVYGLTQERMEAVRESCERLTGRPRQWWETLDEAIEYYESPEGGAGGWFLTRPVTDLLTEDDLVTPYYHASFHQAVPGILTALGLLATFSAILVALSGVSYNASNTVQPVSGIDSLINGLSGKFLSSIIALILGMTFTFVEKKVCERQILRRCDDVWNRLKRLFPFLSQTRILLDLQRIGLAMQSAVSEEAKAAPEAAAQPERIAEGEPDQAVREAAETPEESTPVLIEPPIFSEPVHEYVDAYASPLPDESFLISEPILSEHLSEGEPDEAVRETVASEAAPLTAEPALSAEPHDFPLLTAPVSEQIAEGEPDRPPRETSPAESESDHLLPDNSPVLNGSLPSAAPAHSETTEGEQRAAHFGL